MSKINNQKIIKDREQQKVYTSNSDNTFINSFTVMLVLFVFYKRFKKRFSIKVFLNSLLQFKQTNQQTNKFKKVFKNWLVA